MRVLLVSPAYPPTCSRIAYATVGILTALPNTHHFITCTQPTLVPAMRAHLGRLRRGATSLPDPTPSTESDLRVAGAY